MSAVRIKYWTTLSAALAVVGDVFVVRAISPADAPLPMATIVLAPPYPSSPQRPSTIDASVWDARFAAGVGEDKVDVVTANLWGAIDASILTQSDELRWYGVIVIGSLVPLWTIALVPLLRHQRADLSHV
jgi:hypothetical protein